MRGFFFQVLQTDSSVPGLGTNLINFIILPHVLYIRFSNDQYQILPCETLGTQI